MDKRGIWTSVTDRVTQVCEFSLAMDKRGICKIMHGIGEVVQNMFSVIRQSKPLGLETRT